MLNLLRKLFYATDEAVHKTLHHVWEKLTEAGTTAAELAELAWLIVRETPSAIKSAVVNDPEWKAHQAYMEAWTAESRQALIDKRTPPGGFIYMEPGWVVEKGPHPRKPGVLIDCYVYHPELDTRLKGYAA